MTVIEHGKTAISRGGKMSAPMRMLIERGYLDKDKHNVFDWGHGRGEDMANLDSMGFIVSGWDRFHFVESLSTISEPWELAKNGHLYNWVHCGYVLNILENQMAREDTIANIINFLGGPLRQHGTCHASFAVRSWTDVQRGSCNCGWTEFSDGFITSKGTFQHGFTVAEFVGLLSDSGFDEVNLISKHPLIAIGTLTK